MRATSGPQPQVHPERQVLAHDLSRPDPNIAHGRLGYDEPEHGGGEGQHERFGDDLRDHACAARPQRVADDHLIRASPCARRSASRRSRRLPPTAAGRWRGSPGLPAARDQRCSFSAHVGGVGCPFVAAIHPGVHTRVVPPRIRRCKMRRVRDLWAPTIVLIALVGREGHGLAGPQQVLPTRD
jgi:hypothetical protein